MSSSMNIVVRLSVSWDGSHGSPDLGFKGFISDFYPGSLRPVLSPVGEDVAQELSIDGGGGRRVPIHIKASAEAGDLLLHEGRRAAGSLPVGLSLEGLLAGSGATDLVQGRHSEAVGGEGLQTGHQELGLVPPGLDLRHLLLPVLPDVDLVAGDGVVVVVERDGPGEQDRPAGDPGDHGPVGRRLGGVLDHELHRAGVQPVVDEAVVEPGVLDRDGTEVQAVPGLVQRPPVGVVPLGDLVIEPHQSEAPAGVGGTRAAVTAATDPLHQVDVGGGGDTAARHRDVAARPRHHPGGGQRSW